MDDAQKYLASQIDSSSMEEIVIMLLNRAIKYINDIKKAIDEKDVEKRFFALTKVSDILSFLVVNIKEDKLPSLCKILRICFNKSESIFPGFLAHFIYNIISLILL